MLKGKKVIGLALFLFGTASQFLHAQVANDNKFPTTPSDALGQAHSKTSQSFILETRIMKHNANGSLQDSDIYRLWIRSTPKGDGDDFTCLRYTVKSGKNDAVPISSLVNFTYHISAKTTGSDDNGPIFGISHEPFEKLRDSTGKRLEFEQNYMVYNSFVDFQSFFVFSEKTDSGKGVQDLHLPGDKIVHGAAFSEPHVNLGNQVAEGSYFRNGEITLEWKGMGVINNKRCAILEYDSGQSSFYMIAKPFPLITAKTAGSSHYFGDVYKDLDGGWIQKASMHEWVISETNVSGQSKPIHNVIERTLRLTNLGY
jgi:hypothetical protein